MKQVGLCGSLLRSEDAQVLCALQKAHPEVPSTWLVKQPLLRTPLKSSTKQNEVSHSGWEKPTLVWERRRM